jgi:hypothetical protein
MLLSAEDETEADFDAEADFLEVPDTPGVAEVDGLQPYKPVKKRKHTSRKMLFFICSPVPFSIRSLYHIAKNNKR